MDVDKIVENYFKTEGESLNKENLWEMFDAAYGDLSRLKGKYSIVQEKKSKGVKKTAGEQFILSLPKFTPSDAWGNPNSEARKMMEGYLRQVGGGANIQARLQYLERLSAPDEKGRKITSPRRVISTLILLESLSACFNAFNDSSAGFVFEGFLAAILGGHQETGKSASGALPIQDIFAFSAWEGSTPIPISLKALKRTTKIKGSYTNLVDALNDYPEGMKYIIAYKESEGDKVTAIDIAEFTIDRQNFLDILNVNSAGQDRMRLPDKSSEESYDMLKSIDDWNTLYELLQETKGYTKKAKRKPIEREEEVEVDIIEPMSTEEETQEALNEAAEGSGWHISPAQLATLKGDSKQQGTNVVAWAKLAVLDFSPENLYKTADRYTDVLNNSIRDLFQATAELSKNINAYFSTTERGEAINKGNAAVGNTITIEKEMTAQTVATASDREL